MVDAAAGIDGATGLLPYAPRKAEAVGDEVRVAAAIAVQLCRKRAATGDEGSEIRDRGGSGVDAAEQSVGVGVGVGGGGGTVATGGNVGAGVVIDWGIGGNGVGMQRCG